MKQFQIEHQNAGDTLSEFLAIAGTFNGNPTTLVHIDCDMWADEEIAAIAQAAHKAFPECLVTGSASFGNIVEGKMQARSIVATVAVFEDPSTKIEGMYFPLESGQAADVARKVVEAVNEKPWVKAVGALVMNNGEAMDDFRQAMSEMREDVAIFGGLSHFGHSPDAPKYVIDNDGNVYRWGASFILYGGQNLHFLFQYICGWKALGSEMTATRCTGTVLHELNGKPAYDIYRRYLEIENDENFFYNVLEFPFLCNIDGIEVLRTPIACLDDHSLVMAASVPQGAKLRIAYGDPDGILEDVRDKGGEIADFRPDAITLYTCRVRRTFWSGAGVNREIGPFASVAPTSGRFVAGELLRQGSTLFEFNSTLVVIAVREGNREDKPAVEMTMPEERRRRKSLVSRFATFIDAAMSDLEQTNDELEAANKALEKLSITDELTGLLNRREIERRIRAACADESVPHYVIMMDFDDFKLVNDIYGHSEGDIALETFAKLLQKLAEEAEAKVEVGRWGGEEFILFAETDDRERVLAFAEAVRSGLENAPIEKDYRHTASLGVTKVREGETPDAAIIRADEAMYTAKANGKNQVVVVD